MSDKKYYLELPLSREGKLHQRWPSDPETVERFKNLHHVTESPRRSNSLAIAVTCLLALVFGIALWIGSGPR
jgi:hypothetical protein